VVPVLVFSVCGLLWAAAAAASPMTQSPGVERFNRSQFVAATEWGRKSSTGRAPYGVSGGFRGRPLQVQFFCGIPGLSSLCGLSHMDCSHSVISLALLETNSSAEKLN